MVRCRIHNYIRRCRDEGDEPAVCRRQVLGEEYECVCVCVGGVIRKEGMKGLSTDYCRL